MRHLVLTETIKRTVHCYVTPGGNIRALLATKDHVKVSLYEGATAHSAIVRDDAK